MAACGASIVRDIEVRNVVDCDIVVAVRDVVDCDIVFAVRDVVVRDVVVRDVVVRDVVVRDVVVWSLCTIHPWFFTYMHHTEKTCKLDGTIELDVKFTADLPTDSESLCRVGQ